MQEDDDMKDFEDSPFNMAPEMMKQMNKNSMPLKKKDNSGNKSICEEIGSFMNEIDSFVMEK